jgi:membrane protease YdiL (CAAX protease family)
MTDATASEDLSGNWRRYQFVLWTDVAVPLKAFIVFFALLLVAILVATPLMQRTGTSQAEFFRMLPALGKKPMAVQAMTALSDLVLLFFLWRIGRRVADGSLVARYRSVGRLLPGLALAGGVVLAFVTAFGIAQLASHQVVQFHPRADEQFFVPGTNWQYPIVLVTAGLIAPFVEEFYFRGVLLSWLGAKITIVPAIVLSAAVFGLLHFRFAGHPGAEGWVFTGVIAFVGLINAVLATTTKSLWPPFCLHAAYNTTLVGMALLPRLLG